MNLLQKLKSAFGKVLQYKKLFFTINDKPLTKASKVLMIIFFIVTLIILVQGIELNLKQAERPSIQYGYKCIQLARQADKEYYRKLNLDDFKAYRFSSHKKAISEEKANFGKSKVCEDIRLKYIEIKKDILIQSEITQIAILKGKKQSFLHNQHRINEKYSNMLLEKIANQQENKSILKTRADNAKKELDNLSKKLANIQELIKTKSDMMNYPKIQAFQLLLDEKAERVLEEFSSARKWYSIKRSAQVLGFLVPVWILFFWMFRALTKREKYIFAHLSFYVANAAALLALIELVHVIYVVMPKVFLGKLIAFLVSLNLGIILNVVGIFFFLGLFGFIIMRVQNNQEKTDKTTLQRITNVRQNRCYNCGSPKKADSEFCYNCGEKQKQECKSCKVEILKFTSFCSECGEENLLT